MEADFSGWATKSGLKCSDGRTIMQGAFEHQSDPKLDRKERTVPLVWSHGHHGPENVLGYAVLEHRDEGVWAEGFFNGSAAGQAAKEVVEHGDITWLSIYANKLVERAKQVFHGSIKEVSLVISGANPGAKIEHVRIAHSDDPDDVLELDDEAYITTGLGVLKHSESSSEEENHEEESAEEESAEEEQEQEGDEEESGEEIEHAEAKTAQQVYDEFNSEQKDVVHYMIGAAVEMSQTSAAHSDTNTANQDEGDLAHQEGNDHMSRNVFEGDATKTEGPNLSHDDIQSIFEEAKKSGSLKEAFLAHAEAQDYGIQDIDLLFPDAKSVTTQPDLIARRREWVAAVIDGAKHSPFSRIKSIHADLTADEARAKGYVKGNVKKDEVIKLLKRVTTPTTIYKKQKLDRDDIVDITDLDVVAWLKWEMRFMLEEEMARAILIGDGREPDHEDKIDEEKLRPIAWDHEMYTHPVTVPANTSPEGIIESVLRARKHYKGNGRPTFYTTDDIVTDMILLKDKVGRRLYNTEADLAAALRVDKIVVVEVMEDVPDLLGVIVNISDYTIGADRGGALSMFDDFDLNLNQYLYLMETRISGALTKAKSAVVVRRTSGTTVVPEVPEFDEGTNTLTVPTQAGVSYFDVTDPTDEDALVDGADVVITRTTDVEARPDTGYNFPHNTDADWTFAFTE